MMQDPPQSKGQPPTDWHAEEADAVLEQLDTSSNGLSPELARQRLITYGPNRLPPPKRRSALRRFLTQFHNVLIYVLLVAAGVTLLLGHLVDTGVILGVVLINALIGFIQEGKAEQALEAVRGLLSPQAMVVRQGRRQTISADDLVPGDVVILQSGDRVPADMRLLRVRELRVDEAMLTGESVPVGKHTSPVAAQAAMGDRRDMAFSGTLVSTGQATGVVVATGQQTEIGRISSMLAEVRPLTTPLTRQMATFARWLSGTILVLAVATFAFGTLIRSYPVDEMFLAGIGLAVAAIPEGLPAVITITFAIGVQRMAGRNAIIRRLPAVETLGSVSTICSDKTGTLTRNEMTATSVVLSDGVVGVTGVGYDPHGGFTAAERDILPEERPPLRELCQAGLLCNDARLDETNGQWRLHGDPTEGALVALGMKAGREPELLEEELPRTDVIPFESEHRFMATLHHDHRRHGFIFVKGAPEAVLERCAGQRRGSEDEPLDRDYWESQLEALGRGGQRTLAIAVRPTDSEHVTLRFDDVRGGLTLLGLVGIIDPPRQEAIDAVRRCQRAGITVKMITGDHAATAQAVAGQIGIGRAGGVETGPQLEAMDDQAFARAATANDVFARTSPEHKLRLVEALQANRQVVAMTGDGVNDAPALKRANVGVAMGIKGTEAAKEAAEMVLADDNFASISHAVEEGRTIYDNIKKTILFILPTNGGQALTVLAAIMLGMALPVTPVQILWVNMVTAVTLALALTVEVAEMNVMRRPPRPPDERILSRFMTWRIVFVSLLMVAATFGLFSFERLHGASIEVARTVAVNTLVIAEAFYLLTTRRLTQTAFSRAGITGNRWVFIAIAVVVGLQLLFTYAPLMQTFFGTAPIGPEAWLRLVLAGGALFLLVELEKAVIDRRLRAPPGHPGEGSGGVT